MSLQLDSASFEKFLKQFVEAMDVVALLRVKALARSKKGRAAS